MTQSPPPAPPDAAAPGERDDPWARFGWVMWAPWMVFLAFPLIAAFEADVPPVGRWWVVALTVGFGGVYAVSTHRLSSGRSRPVGGVPESYVVLAVLVLLTVSTAPVLGAGALSFLPFIQSFAMFGLPLPWNWWFTGTVLVASLVGLALTQDAAEWVSFGFILVAVTLGTGAGRFLEQQSEQYVEVRDGLAVSAERERLARDVHDVLGHSLTVVSVKADLAARLLEVDPERARSELEDIQRLSRQALGEIRATVGGLRAARLADELVAARTALLGAGVEPVVPDDELVVDPRYRTVVAWVLREAVTNVVRHSGARRCEVVLAPEALVVRDDGRGLDGSREGNGLRGLRERVEDTGGLLRLSSGGSGAGTCLEVTW
ncbi:sensor histidine kinase [Nocardioides sp. HDW12B]|uniref:sensor histidine kinase n=1 Tax=Nocardioides sp. HDW12B TaxID=2714939 RepID=UPI001F100E48|nr:sensor histidine kinase [Nocardioides sp. HDW12B]